jgi:uncharacterized protein (DUF433 family)
VASVLQGGRAGCSGVSVSVKKVQEVLDEEGESKEVRKHDYGVVSAEACMAAGI